MTPSTTTTTRRRLLAAATAVASLASATALVGAEVASALPDEEPPIPTEPEYSGGLQLVDQKRLVDTRIGNGGTRLSALAATPFDLSGEIPAAAKAIAVNFTVVDAASDGFVVTEAGEGAGCGADTNSSTSSVNYYAADLATANYATIPVGDEGVICVKSLRDADIVIDLLGYWSEEDGGAAQSTTETFRVFDTRDQFLFPDAQYPGGRAGAGTVTRLPRSEVVGGGTPAAVSLTLTATETQAPGFLTAYPCTDENGPVPETSTLNTISGITRSNLTVLGLDATSDVCIFTLSETAFIVDAAGEWEQGISFGFAPLDIPRRHFDTRTDGGVKFTPGEERQVFPDTARTVVANLTATHAEGPGFLAAYPCDSGWDGTSSTNYAVGRANSSAVILDASRGGICVYSHDAADVIFDVFNIQWRNGLAPQTIDLPGEPATDLLYDGDHLWVAVAPESGQARLLELNAVTGKALSDYPVDGSPSILAHDGNFVWYADSLTGTVYKIDPSDGSTVATVDIGTSAGDAIYAMGYLWVTSPDDGALRKIDTIANQVVASVPVGMFAVDIGFDGLHLWVSSSPVNEVRKVNPIANAVMAVVGVSDPGGFVFDGTDMWVTNRADHTLSTINVLDNSVALAGSVGQLPLKLADDGEHIWSADRWDDALTEFDPESGTIVRTVGVGDGPADIVIVAETLWVLNSFDGTLTHFLH